MLNVSDINTSCMRVHACPHLHSIMMASHVCALFLSLEAWSHEVAQINKEDKCGFCSIVWSHVSREWDPGSLSMTRAILILLLKPKKLPIAVSKLIFPEWCHVSPHKFYMVKVVFVSLWLKMELLELLCEKAFLWLFWIQAVPKITREIIFLLFFFFRCK